MPADPQQHVCAHVRRYFSVCDHIGYGEASTGLQNPEGLAQHAVFVAGEIDDAIADHDVDRIIGHGMCSIRL